MSNSFSIKRYGPSKFRKIPKGFLREKVENLGLSKNFKISLVQNSLPRKRVPAGASQGSLVHRSPFELKVCPIDAAYRTIRFGESLSVEVFFKKKLWAFEVSKNPVRFPS